MRWATAVMVVLAAALCLGAQTPKEKKRSGVRMPLSEFLKLVPPPAEAEKPPPPYPAGLSSGEVAVTIDTADAARPVARGTARYALVVPAGNWPSIPILGTGASLLSATLNGRKATVVAKDGWYNVVTDQAGAGALEFAFVVPVKTERGMGAMSLPLAPSAGATVTVTVPGDERVTVSPSAGASHTRTAEKTTAAALVPAGGRPDGALAISWAPTVPVAAEAAVKVYARIDRLAAVADRRLRVLAFCQYSILHAETDRFTLRVPGDVDVQQVHGDRISRWTATRTDTDQRIEVRLAYQAKGEYPFAIEMERAIRADDDRVLVPTVLAENVERQTGDVAVEAWANVELAAESQISDLTSQIAQSAVALVLAPREAPNILRDAATSPIVLAFRPAKPADPVAIRVRRLESADGLAAIIDAADFETLVTRDGRRLTRTIYAVRNRDAQFLRVTLPTGAAIWSASVAGQPVKPADDGRGGRLFALANASAERRSLEPFPVVFVTFQEGAPLATRGRDTLRVDLPTAAVPVRYASYHLRVPDRLAFDAKRFAGTLDHRNVLYQETDALIQSRFIAVDQALIEDMGADWNATLNRADASIRADGTPRPWPDKGASSGRVLYKPFGINDPSLIRPYSGSAAGARTQTFEEQREVFGITVDGTSGESPTVLRGTVLVPTLGKIPVIKGMFGKDIDPRQSRQEVMRNWAANYGKGSAATEFYNQAMTRVYDVPVNAPLPAISALTGGGGEIDPVTGLPRGPARPERYVRDLRPGIDSGVVGYELPADRERRSALATQEMAAGDKAAAANDWVAAENHYQKAVELGRGIGRLGEEAQVKLTHAGVRLGRTPPDAIIEDSTLDRRPWERFVTIVRTKLNEAQDQMRQQNWRAALRTIAGVVQDIQGSGFPEDQIRDYRAAAQRMYEQTRYQVEQQDLREKEEAMKAALLNERETATRFKSEVVGKVRQLIEQGNAYVRQRDYENAYKAAEEALKLDPNNTEAKILRDQQAQWSPAPRDVAAKVRQLTDQGKAYVLARDYANGFKAAEEALKLDPANVEAKVLRDQAQMWAMSTRREELTRERDRNIDTLLGEVEESRIPAPEILHYPEGWAEVAERRKKYNVMALGPKDSWAVPRIREQLAKPVNLEFPSTSFDSVMDFLQDLTNVSIVVDQKAKTAEGITPETMIKLKLQNVRLESALKLILEQVNLDYVIRNDVIYVTNAEGMGKESDIRVYDVRDLVVAMGQLRGEQGPESEKAALDELIDRIRQAAGPSSWSVGGSKVESFRNEMLIITQSPGTQDRIWEYLQGLRADPTRTLAAPRPAAVEIDIPRTGQLFKFERFLVSSEPLYVEVPYRGRE